MPFHSQIYASFVLVLLSYTVREISALNYANVNSGDGKVMLQWTYNNSKLFFNMTCKTTGWCGVGFTTTADGKGMVNYDIAVGGVNSVNMQYLEDYQSTTTGRPPTDTTPDYKLIKVSEENGFTNVEFYRNATTEDNRDVQFMNDTQVWIVWALGSSDTFYIHAHPNRGIVSPQYNLIMEAMSAGIQPSATMIEPSATMMQPSATMMQPSVTTIEPSATMMQPSATMKEPSATMIQPSATMTQPSATLIDPSATIMQPFATMIKPSATTIKPSATMIESSAAMIEPSATMIDPSVTIMQPSGSGPTPTLKNAGSVAESHVVTYAILVLAVCVLHFKEDRDVAF